ncbi:MAG TPA: pyrroloquinoline quinone biosynthesis peptide chaperone PqqD [Caulobacteraceae bacterium]|nr:pyrroloquinoline quinone biosynthesis peptide chaperone PqqD [Caulobacteraceae bacterium]
MTARRLAELGCKPALAAHVRLRFDKARDCWTLQAPERSFMLDETAHAIIVRCDGAADLEAIIEDLRAAFGDPARETVERDVLALVQDLVDKGVIGL